MNILRFRSFEFILHNELDYAGTICIIFCIWPSARRIWVFFWTRVYRSNAQHVFQIWHCPTNLQNTLLMFYWYWKLENTHSCIKIMLFSTSEGKIIYRQECLWQCPLKTILHVTICHVQWFVLHGEEYSDKNSIQTTVRNRTGKKKRFFASVKQIILLIVIITSSLFESWLKKKKIKLFL